MTYLLVLSALVVVPALAVISLRVNGAIAFMSLCLGSVLVTYAGGDVSSVALSFAPSNNTLTLGEWVRLVLLLVPFVLTVLFTHGSIKGNKKFTNVLPALATGMLCALLVVPLLAANVQRQIMDQELWRQLDNLQTAVLLGGAVFSLLFLLFTHRTRGGHDDEGGKKSMRYT